MIVRDPNLKAAIARLSPAELDAIDQAIRTGQVTPLVKAAFNRLKRLLKYITRAEK
jgi:hypothetical protein